MERKGDKIDISFLPIAPNAIRVQSEQMEVTPCNLSPPNSSEKQAFGPRHVMETADFNFEAEVQYLKFKLSMGKEAKLTCVQQSQFTDLIYDYFEVFSLYDEDLSPVNRSNIPYIQHQIDPYICCTALLPHSFKGKCSIFWRPDCDKALLGHHKALIHPRKLLYRKRMGNSSVHWLPKVQFNQVRNAFPLPRIDKALQAIHSSNWFLSLDLAQGYLQLTMEESDINGCIYGCFNGSVWAYSYGIWTIECRP